MKVIRISASVTLTFHLLLVTQLPTFIAGGQKQPTPSSDPGAAQKDPKVSHKVKMLYTAQLSLRDQAEYLLLWGYDADSVTMELHVRTRGWLGFGLAENRNMLGADLVIGWVSDDTGTPHLYDAWSDDFSRPHLDRSQDWRLLAARQNTTHTVIRVSRPIVTCDVRDNVIRNDTMGVIWAYHPDDPADFSSVSYHGAKRRGGRSIQLLTHTVNNKAAAPMPRDAFNIDFNMPNVLLPGRDTAYLCHAFPVPRLGRKHHVIQVDPILSYPHTGLVHHIILYACYHDVDMQSVNTPTECYQHNISPMLALCTAVFAGWAIGGENFKLPEHAGLPLGDSHYPSMMMLQIHYDNNEQRADIRDSSGLRLWMTSYMREHDAAFMQTGVTVDGFQAIPPKADLFTSQGHCLPQCLTEAMKQTRDGIQVFGALLHTHLAGVNVRVRHLREGRELPPLVSDEHYDFNFQETRILPNMRTVLPGDHLITECGYTSGERLLWGGLSTREEMCIAYLLYYPAIQLTNCESRPTRQSALSFLDVQFSRGGEVIWPRPLKGKTYRDVLASVEWDDNTRGLFQQSITSGRVLAGCKMGTREYKVNFKKMELPKILTTWEKKESYICQERRLKSSTSCATLNITSLKSLILSLVLTVLVIATQQTGFRTC